MTSATVRRKGSGKGSEESACGSKEFDAPFPARPVYGTDPRRQGYVAGEILQERENFSSHRAAPLTAPVPFRKTRWTSGKGGQSKGNGSRLAPAPMTGQTAASKVRGLRPCDPARKNVELSLDRRGPSHGSRDCEGAVTRAPGDSVAAPPQSQCGAGWNPANRLGYHRQTRSTAYSVFTEAVSRFSRLARRPRSSGIV